MKFMYRRITLILLICFIIACSGCNDSSSNNSSDHCAGDSASSEEIKDAGTDTVDFQNDPVDMTDDSAETETGQTSDEQIPGSNNSGLPYAIVDTDQTVFYGDTHVLEISPSENDVFYGQDASYTGNQPNYTDNGDGTVTDNNTGLMWQEDPGDKMTYDEAVAGAESFNLAGYFAATRPGGSEADQSLSS